MLLTLPSCATQSQRYRNSEFIVTLMLLQPTHSTHGFVALAHAMDYKSHQALLQSTWLHALRIVL
jgi:hypothetical protein